MTEQEFIALEEGTKKNAITDAKKLAFVASELAERLSCDNLAPDMKEMLPSLMELLLEDIKRAIGHTGTTKKEVEEAIIRAKDNKIKELEDALLNQDSFGTWKSKFHVMDLILEKWWRQKGCKFLREWYIKHGKLHMVLSTTLRDFGIQFSDTPDKDRAELNKKISELEEKGFILTVKKNELIYCEKNKELLTKIVKETFPTAELQNWNHWEEHFGDEKKPPLIIKDFEVVISDWAEMEKIK